MKDGSNPENPTALKRRRVSAACQKCRRLKAKCDGSKPTCERCRAYGYTCLWPNTRHDQTDTTSCTQHSRENTTVSDFLASAELASPVDLLSPLVRFVKPQLSQQDGQRLEAAFQRVSRNSSRDTPSSIQPDESINTATSPQTYLGEASEGHFIDSIRRYLGNSQLGVVNERMIDRSYVPGESNMNLDLVSVLPHITQSEGAKYVQAFTSTIGIAYPFLPLDQVEDATRRWISTPFSNELSIYWQAIVLAVFAIGACYEALSSSESNPVIAGTRPRHWHLFQQSYNLTMRFDHCRDLERVWARLSHCFYLLVTTQIDRCWTHLGQVVRTAHSIGLHVETVVPGCQTEDRIKNEQRRTTWFCLYVLDHLLSLQLGRPPAIYTPFFSTEAPSSVMACLDDGSHLRIADIPLATAEQPVRMYLIAMFDLSALIEEVMQTLYHACNDTAADRYAVATRLDQKLVTWKMGLDRRLRFDLGHAFESSQIHKRHRNFLAVKFYHLRSLIHRPAMSVLKRSTANHDTALSAAALSPDITISLRTCVESAQNTARLLYDVKSREDVIQNFPWWQMISCLTCASSILLVASIDSQLSAIVDVQSVEEDADICLEVFKALSVGSKAAAVALDVMDKLRATKANLSGAKAAGSANMCGNPTLMHSLLDNSALRQHHQVESRITSGPSTYVMGISDGMQSSIDGFTPDDFEINAGVFDLLTWSTQFIDDEMPSSGVGSSSRE